MIRAAVDILLLVLLVRVGLSEVFPASAAWVLAGLMLLASLLRWTARRPRPGGLRADRAFFVGALFMLLMPGAAPADPWLWLPAGGLLLAGAARILSDRRSATVWTAGRKEMLLGGLVTLLAVALFAAADRAIMAYLATAPKFPGRVGFLASMAVWGAIWFGLDAGLRSLPADAGRGFTAWVWDRRHQLGLVCAAAALLMRRLVS